MTLKENITEDIKTAMKAKDQLTLGVLRMAKARFIEFETSGQDKVLDDDKAISILQNLIKQRQDSAKLYKENSRTELAEKELSEVEILNKYLPEAISEEVIRSVVVETVAKVGASSPKDMGKVMGGVMGKLKSMDGVVDGTLVQEVVKESLSA